MRRMKKFITFVMMAALLVSFLPVQAAHAASATYFIPDDDALTKSANLTLTAKTDLSRSKVYVSNTDSLTITGTYSQVTSTSMNLTVDLMTFGDKGWQAESGKTSNMKVTSSGSNRFSVKNVELFPGYNRLTFTGTQGSVTKKDVFYVLYDAAPLLNSLSITSDGVSYDLNEGAALVVTDPKAVIQGTSSNVDTVMFNGSKATVTSSGNFYAPAVTLTPGLNTFEIILSNNSDSLTLTRQVYYYDEENPFTAASVTMGSTSATQQTKSIFDTEPTFTADGTTATLTLEYLLPGSNDKIPSSIKINDTTIATSSATITETPYTTGDNTYKLIKMVVPYDLLTDSTNTTNNGLATAQPVHVKLVYNEDTTSELNLTDDFAFTLASDQTIVTSVKLLTDYSGTGEVTSGTTMQDLNGSDVTSPSFYVLVATNRALTSADTLGISLQPAGTVTLDVYKSSVTSPANTVVYRISNFPQGQQTVAFTVNGSNALNASVNYVSKNYVSVENIYDGLVLNLDSSKDNSIKLNGEVIGFGDHLLSSQLLINKVTKPFAMSTADSNGDRTITEQELVIDKDNGPLFFGQNTIEFIIKYKDSNGSTLRTYNKLITFYILDTNAPNIEDIRPLTVPTSTRGDLGSSDSSKYLPASPEFQDKGTYYSTTQDKMDLFIEGSGASDISVKEGGTEIMHATMDTASSSSITITGKDPSSLVVDTYGNGNSFRFRIRDYDISDVGTHAFTITVTNDNGATASQTLEVHRENVSYRLLSPVPNTDGAIVVNKNFVLFDIEAEDATDVQINGQSATPRTDVDNRYMYTYIGLKGDKDNKIKIVIKKDSGDINDTVTVRYVTDPAVGTMYMEEMSSKHSVFNKDLQLSFPKNTILRRTTDGKIQPTTNLLFGIADPETGNTELVNDYGQELGTDKDSRTEDGSKVIRISNALSSLFEDAYGRDHFTPISNYYWISGGLADTPSDETYEAPTGGIAPYSTVGTFTQYDEERLLAPSQRGELTLKYNEDVVSQAGSEVTVFYLGNNGEWRNLGGETDTKSHTITVPFDDFGFYVVSKLNFSFEDVTNHAWARDLLQALYAKGFMPNLYYSTFGTDDYITRGEFAGLLVRSLGLKLNYDDHNSFIDIVPGSQSVTWTYEEIETAARAGIVQGLDNQVFSPDLEISRQDASVMIARALSISLASNDSKLEAKLAKTFADASDISYYARPAVMALYSAKILQGSTVDNEDGTTSLNFNPTADMTRAEAGQIAVRLLQKYSSVFPKNLS